jgi:uncharacterized membrane protein
MQLRMRDLAREAVAGGWPLPSRYHHLFRLWLVSGVSAFAAVLAILWLMLTKPDLPF